MGLSLPRSSGAAALGGCAAGMWPYRPCNNDAGSNEEGYLPLNHRSVHRGYDQNLGLITLPHHWLVKVARTAADFRFFLHMTGKVRRFWMVHFRKGHVRHQLSIRGGSCRQCGTCCNLLFTCPMLMRQGRCFVYGYCRPGACKVFPIDQRDIDEVSLCGGRCGYRFD